MHKPNSIFEAAKAILEDKKTELFSRLPNGPRGDSKLSRAVTAIVNGAGLAVTDYKISPSRTGAEVGIEFGDIQVYITKSSINDRITVQSKTDRKTSTSVVNTAGLKEYSGIASAKTQKAAIADIKSR